MGEALAIIIAFAALLGISWGVTCAAVVGQHRAEHTLQSHVVEI